MTTSFAQDTLSKAGGVMRQYGALLAVMVVLFTFFAIIQPQFATVGNVLAVLSTNVPLFIIALALTATLIVGGFDLSLAGVLVLSGVIVALLHRAGTPIGLAILIAIVAMTIFGAVLNGISIAFIKLNFFVVTLATLSIASGAALVLASGTTIRIESDFMRQLGSGSMLGMPNPIIVAAIVFALLTLMMRYTGFGRMIYAVGGNSEASRLAGIPVNGVRVATYALGALLAALAGVVQSATLVSASSTTNQTILLNAAAVAFIGGVSFSGGKGTMLGTLLGFVFIAFLQNGLLILAVPVYWQGVITGTILLISIGLDRFRTQRRRRRITRVTSMPEQAADREPDLKAAAAPTLERRGSAER